MKGLDSDSSSDDEEEKTGVSSGIPHGQQMPQGMHAAIPSSAVQAAAASSGGTRPRIQVISLDSSDDEEDMMPDEPKAAATSSVQIEPAGQVPQAADKPDATSMQA